MNMAIYILTGLIGFIALALGLKKNQAGIGVFCFVVAVAIVILQVKVDNKNTTEQEAKDKKIDSLGQKAESIDSTLTKLRKDRTVDSTNYVQFFTELKAEYKLTRDSTTNKVKTVNTYITNARDVYIGDRE